MTPPAGYDPTIQGCYYPVKNPLTNGGVFDLYWKNVCVGYSVAAAASSQVTLDQATRVAAQAFAAWSGATCPSGAPPSVVTINEGPVQCDEVRYNAAGGNQHVIAFRDDGWPHDDSSNTLGLTTLTVDMTTGEILDADIEINSHDFTLTVDGAPSDSRADAGGASYDLLGILTHEAGHFLGLAHSDDPGAVMYARYTPLPGPIAPDDVDGVCAIDPSNATRSTSVGAVAAAACDPTPVNGFSTSCAGLIAGDAGPQASSAMCATNTGCSVSAGRSPPGLALQLLGLVGLGLLAVLRRTAPRIRWKRAPARQCSGP